jgi:hypothetical protein
MEKTRAVPSPAAVAIAAACATVAYVNKSDCSRRIASTTVRVAPVDALDAFSAVATPLHHTASSNDSMSV